MANAEEDQGTDSSVDTVENGYSESIEELQAENERLHERLDEIESAIEGRDRSAQSLDEENTDAALSSTDEDSSDGAFPVSRRGVMGGAAALGLLGLTSGTASAASPGDTLQFAKSFAGTTSTGYGLELIEQSGSGTRFGMIGKAASPGGRGLFGHATAKNGGTFGVIGRSDSDSGVGVLGNATASTGVVQGVKGVTNSTENGTVGVLGRANASTGNTYGVLGKTTSPTGRGLVGQATSTTGSNYGLIGRSDSKDGVGVLGNAVSTSGTANGLEGRTQAPSGFGIYTPDDAKVDGNLDVGGTLNVTKKKNFVQTVDTAAGPKKVHYTAVEAGDAQTEHTDTAEMEDGHALIELPAHFDMVTSDEEPVAVQVTPHAEEKVHPQVVEKSTKFVSVQDFGDGPDDYSFSYTVKGVRDGFEDDDIVRDA